MMFRLEPLRRRLINRLRRSGVRFRKVLLFIFIIIAAGTLKSLKNPFKYLSCIQLNLNFISG